VLNETLNNLIFFTTNDLVQFVNILKVTYEPKNKINFVPIVRFIVFHGSVFYHVSCFLILLEVYGYHFKHLLSLFDLGLWLKT